ncbi:hypothetical protein JWS13_04510 (plasmid) [Rhodococcus pseudokoreensis]|uniref:Uncharacterized protein n=1 Tax=Rhodococcus pseudokoreensis TaxID=2811421 RepID=A0A974VYJ1_9NOCA|nr:hypothetical protein [Rhodococcus pseudokoreensis]QSE87884.1 hypothetical protein JWS13_04510 [Rhodococcus pseudokoreensis]
MLENTEVLTASVTGTTAAVTVTAPENMYCQTPTVVRGPIDAAALREALADWDPAASAQPDFTGTGFAAEGVYPPAGTLPSQVIDVPDGQNWPGFEDTPFTVTLNNLPNGDYGAFTGCVQSADDPMPFHIRNFRIGPDLAAPNPGMGSADLGNLFGSS